MHQIRFRLGLRPTPHWGSSQRSPRPISCNTGRLTSKEKGGREENRGRKNQEEREGGEEKETKSPIHVSGYATEKQKRGRATKREKMERMKKLRGRGGRQSWGEGCLLALREDGRPCSSMHSRLLFVNSQTDITLLRVCAG